MPTGASSIVHQALFRALILARTHATSPAPFSVAFNDLANVQGPAPFASHSGRQRTNIPVHAIKLPAAPFELRCALQ